MLAKSKLKITNLFAVLSEGLNFNQLKIKKGEKSKCVKSQSGIGKQLKNIGELS